MSVEDYFIRYMEKFARALGLMIGFRQKGRPEESIRIATQFYDEQLDIPPHESACITDKAFIPTVQKQNYDQSALNYLAQIAHETAKAYEMQYKGEKARSFYSISYALYLMATEKDRTYSPERELLMKELSKKLKEEK
ncbi:MAG: hypothetical protein LBH80_02705 [Prevotellaceae bacterium]|jgi:hypothetical protein|nr:hypothetical protein [Prevotellaceae bacterium]